jgi:hypothetical protein
VVARGSLAYAATWTRDRLITVELQEQFELVVRDARSLRELRRLVLGPHDNDVSAVAADDRSAWVGDRAGWIRQIDLGSGHELARWPQGAPITAIAADARWIVASDATGVICLRRITGLLLQCFDHARPDVSALTLDGHELHVHAGRGHRAHFAVPGLQAVDGPDRGAAFDDARPSSATAAATVAGFDGKVRAMAIGPAGQLVVVGWPRTLADPSVVVWLPGASD